MKPIYKYIFAAIIILLLTTTAQSAPKAYDSLGNKLEALQKDCEQYLKDSKVSKKLKATCEKFNINVNKAFNVGYPLDASVESGTVDEKKAAGYLALLLKVDESRKSLRELMISLEKKRAKEEKAKFDKQINAYRKACDGGDAKVCYTFGVMFYEGQELKQDYEEAARLFRKACTNGNAKGCYDLGHMIGDGQGIKRNHEEAAKLFGKACEGGNVDGCKKHEMIQNDAKLKQIERKLQQLREEEFLKRKKEKAEGRRKFHEEYPDWKDKQRQAREESKKRLALARKINRKSSATNRIHIGESTTIEYTYKGFSGSQSIIRKIKINITNNYAKMRVGDLYDTRIDYGNFNDRDIKVFIENLGFDPFIVSNDQIFQMDRGSIIKNGGMRSSNGSINDRIEIRPGETGSFFVRVERFVDKIYIKQPNKEGGTKTVLALDVPQ